MAERRLVSTENISSLKSTEDSVEHTDNCQDHSNGSDELKVSLRQSDTEFVFSGYYLQPSAIVICRNVPIGSTSQYLAGWKDSNGESSP